MFPEKLNVGKRTATSKNTKDKGFTKEHNIPTKFIYDAIKKAVFNDKVIEMFDLIMKDNFQVLLNSDDDEKLNNIFDEIDSNSQVGEFTQDEPAQEDQEVEEEQI